MYQSKTACGYPRTRPGRFANAVYTYSPDFKTGAYKDGVVEESPDHVTFELYSPYIIAATPPNNSQNGIYKSGGTNGFALKGSMTCPVKVSIDQGHTWKDAGSARDGINLTIHLFILSTAIALSYFRKRWRQLSNACEILQICANQHKGAM